MKNITITEGRPSLLDRVIEDVTNLKSRLEAVGSNLKQYRSRRIRSNKARAEEALNSTVEESTSEYTIVITAIRVALSYPGKAWTTWTDRICLVLSIKLQSLSL